MVRSLTLTASLLLAGTTQVLAQGHSHTPPHPPIPHGPGHVRPDSADHAAMHAPLHGSWTGTMRTPQGDSATARLSVAFDSAQSLAISLAADQPFRIGPASHFVVQAGNLSWTQEVSGRPCRATALVHGPAGPAPGTMDGRMTCPNGDMTFTLHKTAG